MRFILDEGQIQYKAHYCFDERSSLQYRIMEAGWVPAAQILGGSCQVANNISFSAKEMHCLPLRFENQYYYQFF
jgi:hypothetical protein